MQIFKKVVLAALIAGSALGAQSAMASGTAAGAFSAQEVDDAFGGFTLSFGNNFATTGTFDDAASFTMGSAFQAGGSVSSNFTATQSLTLTAFNLVSYSSFDSNGNPIADSTIVGVQAAPNYFTINVSNLASGNYYLEMVGTVTGVNGGSYGGSLNATAAVTAVPEPATYGMLLGGLGLIGFAARRKKQS